MVNEQLVEIFENVRLTAEYSPSPVHPQIRRQSFYINGLRIATMFGAEVEDPSSGRFIPVETGKTETGIAGISLLQPREKFERRRDVVIRRGANSLDSGVLETHLDFDALVDQYRAYSGDELYPRAELLQEPGYYATILQHRQLMPIFPFMLQSEFRAISEEELSALSDVTGKILGWISLFRSR